MAPPISVTVDLKGFFFTGNPIGRLHRNVYTVLKDEGDYAVEATRAQLTTGHGLLTGRLQRNIVKVPKRMRRGVSVVLVSANYGPEPLVRFYNRFIDTGVRKGTRIRRGINFYRAGARLTQQHIDGRLGQIADKLVEGLT